MAAPVDIMNVALAAVGAKRITSPSDDSKEGRICNAQYPIVRDAELRTNLWSFAITRIQIAALSTAPAFGFALAYNLPADCIRVVQVGDLFPGIDMTAYRDRDLSAFMIEGRQILTGLNDGTAAAPMLNLRYVKQLTDASVFDPCFVQSLGYRLAMAICVPLTESTTKLDSLSRLYDLSLKVAASTNAIEKPPSPLPDDSWLMSRVIA